jgi:uncharacterized protein involved in response to NO
MSEATLHEGPCRHPYRILFPLGWGLAWAGLLPWAWFGFGEATTYPRDLHALILVQAALLSCAAGFLFTMLPRRTGSAAPRPGQLAFCTLAPPFITLLAYTDQLGLAHLVWLFEALLLLQFALHRLYGRASKRRAPVAFLWVPIGLTMGIGGAILAAIRSLDGGLNLSDWVFGQLLLTQGLFLCLAFGVGNLFIPLTSHKQSSLDADQNPRARLHFLGHALAALTLVASFAMEAYVDANSGRLLRSLTALLVLVFAAGIHRPPTIAGTQRKLIWLACWCIPVGLLLTVLIPWHPQIGLHVLFIGGFAMLTFSVALHVALAHSGGQHLVSMPVAQTRAFGMLLAIALACRIAAELNPERQFTWIGAGAITFLAALLPWGLLVLPRTLPLLRKPKAP